MGSTSDLAKRRTTHLWALRSGKHHSIKFQRAWDKYGADAFEFDVLIFCPEKDLLWHEQVALDAFDAVRNGYNVSLVAERNFSMKGRKHSDKTRRKMSESAKKARKLKRWSSTRGRHLSAKTRKKIGEANRQRVWSEESRRRKSEAQLRWSSSIDQHPRLGKKNPKLSEFLREHPRIGDKNPAFGRKRIDLAQRNHIRWHTNRNIVNPLCSLCSSEEVCLSLL